MSSAAGCGEGRGEGEGGVWGGEREVCGEGRREGGVWGGEERGAEPYKTCLAVVHTLGYAQFSGPAGHLISTPPSPWRSVRWRTHTTAK